MPALEPSSWQGTVLRHLPAGAPFAPLDPRFAGRSRENRWNTPGEPTIVFASDRETLLREFQAHLSHDRDPDIALLAQPRQLYACDLRLRRVFDLRDPATLEALGIRDAPACFADRTVARAAAGFLRHVRHADGLLVPSVTEGSTPECWNLVLFLDQIEKPLSEIVHAIRPLEIVQPGSFA